MIQLFTGLTLVNLLCLGLATWLGYSSLATAGQTKPMHILAGALATLVCCGVHCVVFTYFIATAKWVRHAVQVKRLDESFVRPTRSFKAQAFPAALLAMAAVFATAVLGAARDNYGIPRLWHHAPALAALVVNVLVAGVEFRAIRRNGLLIDRILAAIADQAMGLPSADAPPTHPAPVGATAARPTGLTPAAAQANIPADADVVAHPPP